MPAGNHPCGCLPRGPDTAGDARPTGASSQKKNDLTEKNSTMKADNRLKPMVVLWEIGRTRRVTLPLGGPKTSEGKQAARSSKTG